MKFPAPHFLKHRASGIIRVKIRTPRGNQYVSTGQTSYARAREVCSRAMLDELQMAACATALTPDVISRLVTGRRFTCEDIREAWAIEAADNLSPDTFHAYDTSVRAWLAFSDTAGVPISAVKRPSLNAWINQPGSVASTRRSRLSALRSYFSFASHAGYCVGNMAARAKVNLRELLFAEREGRETLPITPEEFERLMASPKCAGFHRWSAAFGYWLGWRLRDIACLEWASIKGLSMVIYARKNGCRLELDATAELFGGGAIHRVIMEILEQPQAHPQFCFPEKREIALAPKRRAGLSVAFKNVLARHHIPDKRFHSLRHAFAMRLKAAGWPDADISVVMGHRSPETTATYTSHDTPRQGEAT